MLENAETIILDQQNNTVSGPGGYFTIVIDSFDGSSIKAWHIETRDDKTSNLAGRANGRHIDLVVGEECRSTGFFFNQMYKGLYLWASAGK